MWCGSKHLDEFLGFFVDCFLVMVVRVVWTRLLRNALIEGFGVGGLIFFTSNDEKLMLSVLRDLTEEKARLWQESRRRGDISKLYSLSWWSW